MSDHDPQAALAAFIEPFRVAPGAAVTLGRDYDPGFKAGMKKRHGVEALAENVEVLADLQARLSAQDTTAVLVVLQGMDASGKDGTIRHVLSGLNPQGVSVHSFKVPSAEELSHDYLWRYQQHLPGRGEIGVFNRSHYEEVLVVRVHPENLDRQRLPSEDRGPGIWKRRFREINDWERYLADNGVHIVKLCLNLSNEEQRARLLKRTDLPDHNWKFSISDVEEREHWDAYQHAYSEMLSHTSTPWAPWHVIPADHKWFARIAVSSVITAALGRIDPRFPTVDADGLARLAEARAALEAQAPAGGAADPNVEAG
jgi:PPK2 family polyphosphate:nucleotide phosphotransferase